MGGVCGVVPVKCGKGIEYGVVCGACKVLKVEWVWCGVLYFEVLKVEWVECAVWCF